MSEPAFPLWLNAALFAFAATGVWIAGAKLARSADTLAARWNIGRALIGLVFLATVTELPEIATTFSAAIAGNAALVLNNLFGGITLQTAILAIVDALIVRGALTSYPRRPTHTLEASLLAVLLTLLLMICVLGDRALLVGIGLGSTVLALAYGFSIFLLRRHDEQQDWIPVELPEIPEQNHASHRQSSDARGTKPLIVASILCIIVIFVSGVLLVYSAENLAVQTGLGASFIGVTLLALATSLPELSTTIAAARLGAYPMAISNIFGSNLIMLALLLPADTLYRSGPILADAGRPEVLALLSGLLVTGIYITGLIVRRKPVVLGMGLDSALVAAVYGAAVVTLYLLR